MKREYALSDTEAEIMELLWDEERKIPSKEILDFFNAEKNKDWKKQTLNTFLFRLLEKGLIQRTSEERRYLYSPTITRSEFERFRAECFIKQLFNGSFSDFITSIGGGELITVEQAEKIKKIIKK